MANPKQSKKTSSKKSKSAKAVGVAFKGSKSVHYTGVRVRRHHLGPIAAINIELKSAINRISNIEEKLKKQEQLNNDLMVKISHRDYLNRLGIPYDDASEGITVPLRIYLSDEEGKESAENLLLDEEVIKIVAIGNGVIGSWFRVVFYKIMGRDAEKYISNLEKAAELKALGKPQAEVNKHNAEAILMCTQALEKTREGVIQNGSILISKYIDKVTGNGIILTKVLTVQELIFLEKNSALCSQPHKIFSELESANLDYKKPMLISDSN